MVGVDLDLILFLSNVIAKEDISIYIIPEPSTTEIPKSRYSSSSEWYGYGFRIDNMQLQSVKEERNNE